MHIRPNIRHFIIFGQISANRMRYRISVGYRYLPYIKKKAGLADKPDYLVHFYKSLTIIIAVPVAWRLVQYRNPPRMALPASLTRMCEARSDRWTTPCEYQPVNRYIQYNRFKPWMKFFQKKRSPKAKKIYRVYSGLGRIHIIYRIRLLICTSGQ